ncbi:MAG: lamin tail domain-containing protein [bacterium]|nr:lamin tail domain-containing protein [bacterium]
MDGSLIWLLFTFLSFSVPVWADSFDFGRVRVGTSQPDTLSIKNENPVDLMILQSTLTAPEFSLPADPFSGDGISILPGESKAFQILFSPTGTGHVEGQLNILTALGQLAWSLAGAGCEEVVLLADPPTGPEGDANGDGVRDSNADEFVELLNTGNYPVSMGGWQLFDAGASEANRMVFPTNTWIGPGERVVVFGGGAPQGIPGQVFVDDGRIGGGLRNSGDEVYLFDPVSGDTLASAAFGSEAGHDASVVRLDSASPIWQRHTDFPGDGAFFSPGRPRIVVTHLTISPRDTAIEAGGSLSVTATARWSDGQESPVAVENISWGSSDESVLLSDEPGSWFAQTLGRVEIKASWHGFVSDTIQVHVTPPDIAALALVVSDTIALPGDELQLTVTGMEGLDSRVLSETEYAITLSDSGVIAYLPGRVVAHEKGRATVWVRYGDLADSLTIYVAGFGDINADGDHSLWDIVRMVHLILGIPPEGQDFERRAADMTHDGLVDIRDLISSIQAMVGGSVAASKATRSKRPVGWTRRNAGISIYPPDQTLAIGFDISGSLEAAALTTATGKVFSKTTIAGTKGMIIFSENGAVTSAPEAIDLIDWPQSTNGNWVAWGLNGTRQILDEVARVPVTLALHTLFPNPSNPASVVHYSVPFEQDISLDVYAVTGQHVKTLYSGRAAEGAYRRAWDGRDEANRPVASGLYFVRLHGNDESFTLKLIVMR